MSKSNKYSRGSHAVVQQQYERAVAENLLPPKSDEGKKTHALFVLALERYVESISPVLKYDTDTISELEQRGLTGEDADKFFYQSLERDMQALGLDAEKSHAFIAGARQAALNYVPSHQERLGR